MHMCVIVSYSDPGGVIRVEFCVVSTLIIRAVPPRSSEASHPFFYPSQGMEERHTSIFKPWQETTSIARIHHDEKEYAKKEPLICSVAPPTWPG